MSVYDKGMKRGKNMIHRKWKYLCLIFSCFLFTGCTAEYNLNILDNFTITENISISDGETKYSPSNMISSVENDYGTFYDIYPLGDGYYCVDESCKNIVYAYGFAANRTYEKLNLISSSSVINEYFGTVSITNNGNIYTLTATPGNQLVALLTDVNYVKAALDTLEVNVSVPYKVTSHNADNVQSNIYTWKYNAKNSTKKIELSFDIKNESDYNDIIDNNTDVNLETVKNSSNIWKYIGIIGAIVIIGVILYFMHLKDKNNSI